MGLCGEPVLARFSESVPTTGRKRVIAVVIALFCLALLLCAGSLTPSVAGHGTHEQLNLPACGLLESTGYPCPTCGMTTAFSLVARARIGEALMVQPAGAMAALATMISLVVSSYAVWTGRIPKLAASINIHYTFIAGTAIILLSWFWLCLLAWLKQ